MYSFTFTNKSERYKVTRVTTRVTLYLLYLDEFAFDYDLTQTVRNSLYPSGALTAGAYMAPDLRISPSTNLIVGWAHTTVVG